MKLFSKKKYSGPDSRMGGSDRRFPGRWATHIWGIILLLVFLAGNGVGYNLRADTSSIERSITSVSEGDSIRSQVLLDSLISFASKVPETIERVVLRDVLVYDTVSVVDTLLVPQEPQIIRVVETKEVLVIDTVFAPPQIITIPAPDRGYFSSHYFLPRAGNLLYLLGGVALGSILDNDASACIFISTDGTVRENCDPKR
jgi:hypothetical protein